MELVFEPMLDEPGAMTAIIPVNDHFRVAVSHGKLIDGTFLGTPPHDYTISIQAVDFEKSDMASLVEVDGKLHKVGCSNMDIQEYIKIAKSSVYAGIIKVAKPEGGGLAWKIRFMCAAGEDFKNKVAHCRTIWGVDGFKIDLIHRA